MHTCTNTYIQPPDWDMKGWMQRFRQKNVLIDVSNTDLLWRTYGGDPLMAVPGTCTCAYTYILILYVP